MTTSITSTELLSRHLPKGGSITHVWHVIWSYAWHAPYWQSYGSTMESSQKGK